MFGSVRVRLMLGYVGIFALILVLLEAVVVLGFSHQLSVRQDHLLAGEAKSLARFPGKEVPEDRGEKTDYGEFVWARVTPEGNLRDRSPSASSLGLPEPKLAREAARQKDTLISTMDGTRGEVKVVSTPAFDSGKVVAIVQVAQPRRAIHDTIERLIVVIVPLGVAALVLAAAGGLFMSTKALRPMKEAFEKQRSFIADASHELKTPLTLIRTDAEVAIRAPLDEKVRGILEHQLYETERMAILLSDLLLLARLDAGKLAVEHEPFDLAEAASEAAERFMSQASAQDIRLEVEAAEQLWGLGDRERTGQILAALLENALKYTFAGNTIIIALHSENGEAVATVSDTGSGISPEHLPNIFDRFSHPRRGGRRDGTGLGLSIARDLARAQGGELSVSSEKGQGTSFRLEIPASD